MHHPIRKFTMALALAAAPVLAGAQQTVPIVVSMEETRRADPGMVFDVRYDDKGDLDRESFVVKVVNGRAQVTERLKPSWAAQ